MASVAAPVPVDVPPMSPTLAETPSPAHKEIASRETFLQAIQTKERYVLLYAYTGEVSEAAEA